MRLATILAGIVLTKPRLPAFTPIVINRHSSLGPDPKSLFDLAHQYHIISPLSQDRLIISYKIGHSIRAITIEASSPRLKKCFSSARFPVDRPIWYAKRRYTHQGFFDSKSLHSRFSTPGLNASNKQRREQTRKKLTRYSYKPTEHGSGLEPH